METLQEISLAQSKLSEITTAINREQVIIEEKSKEVSLLKKQEKELLSKVQSLKDESDSIEKRNDLLKGEYKDSLIIYEAQRNDLLIEMKDIEKQKSELMSGFIEESNKIKSDTLKLEKDLAKQEKSLSSKISLLQEKVDTLTTEKEIIISDNANIKSDIILNKDNLNNINKLHEEKSLELNKVDTDLNSLRQEEDRLAKAIKDSKSEITELNGKKDSIDKEIKDCQISLEVIKGELGDQEDKKSEFVKRFTQLDEREKANNIRENILKEKYEKAGIVYP